MGRRPTPLRRVAAYLHEAAEEVFEGGKLRDQLLHHFAERLEYRVVVDGGEVETATEKPEGLSAATRTNLWKLR